MKSDDEVRRDVESELSWEPSIDARDNARHVRNAMARFDQVQDVTDAERDLAFANIQAAANYFGIDMKETNWRQLGARRT